MGKKIIVTDVTKLKLQLTKEEALELLAPHLEGKKKRVHTFNGGYFGILMGCDMDLTEVKKALKNCKEDEISLSGANMRGMGHGVAYYTEKNGWIFLESDKKKIDTINKLRNIK